MVFAPGDSSDAPNADSFSPVMPTSPTNVPPGVTTVPPFTIESSFITLLCPPEQSEGSRLSRQSYRVIPSRQARDDRLHPRRLRGRRVAFDNLVSALILVAVRPADLRLQHQA